MPASALVRRHRFCAAWLALLVACAASGACSEGHRVHSGAGDSAGDGAGAGDGAAPAADDSLQALIHDAIEAYGRAVEATCPCDAAIGAFPSTQECVRQLGPADDWDDCLATAAAEHDSPALRDDIACMSESAQMRAQCFEAAACDEQARIDCSANTIDCGVPDAALLTHLLTECPDLILLGR